MSEGVSEPGDAAMRRSRDSGTKFAARDLNVTSTIYHLGLSLSVFYTTLSDHEGLNIQEGYAYGIVVRVCPG